MKGLIFKFKVLTKNMIEEECKKIVDDRLRSKEFRAALQQTPDGKLALTTMNTLYLLNFFPFMVYHEIK